jgi:hypothetical protein
LNFARSKTLDPRITFERASIGTYVDENGLIKTAAADEARFDHNPETGESLGLLIEEQRTNIALNSEDFSTRSATNYGTKSSVTTNATIAPDGTQTADLVTTVTTTTQNRLGNLHSVTSGQYYTYSVYVKQGNKSNVSFYLGYTALINASMSFTFATETLSAGGGTYLSGSAGFDKLDNGWYRLYFTGQAFNSGNTYSGFISGTDADETFYIWGEQIEIGTFPTSYIPTSGSTVTRQPDNASITGTNFSDWYNKNEGTLFNFIKINSSYPVTGKGSIYSVFNDNSFDNVIRLGGSTGSSQLNFDITNSGTLSRANLGNFTSTTNKVIGSYKLSDSSGTFNGNTTISCSPVPSNLPSVTQFNIGNDHQNGQNYLNGHIKQILYYPERLTNAQLQNLTK